MTTIIGSGNIEKQEIKFDADKSEILWTGKKIGGHHNGAINLKSGYITVENNMVTGGEFVIDMSSIKNLDLKDEGYSKQLVDHLKSDDFFSVEKHPEAILVIKGETSVKDNEADVKGDLTIKGITHPIEFKAKKDGNKFTADIIVDRSKYNVRYGSKSFFNNLGDKLIYDNFELNIQLLTVE